MSYYFSLIVFSMLVSNMIFQQFLGICPYLGVSKQIGTAAGMGGAVVFVMAMTSIVTWPVQKYVLGPLGLDYLQTITFILVIASLVQLVEMILRKHSPALYRALGIYLPLITTNCAILGIAILSIRKDMDFFSGILFSVGSGLGFAIALFLFAGIRERLETSEIPEAFRGVPIALITAGILALAFGGFAGLVKI